MEEAHERPQFDRSSIILLCTEIAVDEQTLFAETDTDWRCCYSENEASAT